MQKVSYMGNGSTTDFTFNFPYFENSNIIVTKNNVTATGYNIVGTSGGLDADIPYTGGKVVFDVAPTALDSITIARNLPLTRIVDYQPTAKLEPTTLNQDANYLMEVIKDRKDEIDSLYSQYSDIANKESTTTLLARITEIHNEIVAVSAQITALGDITTLRSDVSTNTGNITTLDTRTTGLLDYVIASQAPTADNNYTWYRKYKSGWVEQGGHEIGSLSGEKVINLPITMAHKRYQFMATFSLSDNDNSPETVLAVRRQRNSVNDTTSSIAVLATYTINGANGYTGWDFDWEVKGFAA